MALTLVHYQNCFYVYYEASMKLGTRYQIIILRLLLFSLQQELSVIGMLAKTQHLFNIAHDPSILVAVK